VEESVCSVGGEEAGGRKGLFLRIRKGNEGCKRCHADGRKRGKKKKGKGIKLALGGRENLLLRGEKAREVSMVHEEREEREKDLASSAGYPRKKKRVGPPSLYVKQGKKKKKKG